MRILGACVLLLLASALRADAEGDYAKLLEAFQNKQWPRALELSEAFVKAHPGFRHTHAAYYMGGNAALNCNQPARGEPLYRALLKDHPQSRHVEKARTELVNLLADARKLADCIAQCDANLAAAPGHADAEYWHLMRGECQLRLWQFKQAEQSLSAFLKDHPQSRYAGRARAGLDQINPPLKADADGVVQGYAGKYAQDARFSRARAALPAHVAAGWAVLRETLGLELAGRGKVLFEFKDKGFTRDTERAIANTIAIEYQPVTLITLYTEHVVVHEEDFRSRVIHELKHAAFRGVMGQRYLDLPKWVREGLAVYGARQTEDRVHAVLSNEFFAGNDPRRVLDGIDDPDHDVTDYVEDALAFVWLESRRKGAVHEFCKRLCAGEDWDKLFAELAGMDLRRALDTAAREIHADLDRRLGDGERELRSIQSEQAAAQARRDEANWAATKGIARYEAWLDAHKDHLLAQVARYRLARALIAAGRHEQARRILAVVAADELRSTLTDDAVFWTARSFEIEGKSDQARAAWGVLMRDYSWCSYAVARKDTHTPAGPVKE
ncbi:MAG: outer membrane protein assembly factor BamD [Planctomycetes bacterium]|jgi:outer membrane protein assembly factor BamD (BamD/ComL family)|nr:outer membrane protein assembly factor BamD [Planctomycetota bacterium]MCL4730836.1 outer membrane protein assembly factor BamD [Planctomycetota bacterium]